MRHEIRADDVGSDTDAHDADTSDADAGDADAGDAPPPHKILSLSRVVLLAIYSFILFRRLSLCSI